MAINALAVCDFDLLHGGDGEKDGTMEGTPLKKLRSLLQQSVVILSGNLLSSGHVIANTGHDHFQFAGQFRE
jgi:hypothetical protein